MKNTQNFLLYKQRKEKYMNLDEAKQELIEHGYIITEYKSRCYTDEFIWGEDIKGKLE